MIDRLDALLSHFSVQARMFHSGALCGVNELPATPDLGQLHLVKRGPVEVSHESEQGLHIANPSLLLYPRPLKHKFITDVERGAELACANLHFDGGVANPVAAALPAVICLPLAEIEGAEGVLSLLFDEAFNQRCGRRVLVNRLFEVVLIQVLRHLMESGQIRSGMLAGMEHLALWTDGLARVRNYYVTYFGAVAGSGYRNPAKGFESVFLSFSDGARLEFMKTTTLRRWPSNPVRNAWD